MWRSVWAWPLHSRTRALITLVAVVAVLLVIGKLASLGGEHPAVPPATPPAAAPVPAVPSTSSTVKYPPVPAPDEPVPATGLPAPQEALRAAGGFVRNWASHPAGISTDEWVSNMEPYAMPELAGQLHTTEPGNVPATRVTGVPAVTALTEARAEIRWPTDGGTVIVTVIHPTGPWQVAKIGLGDSP